MASSDEGEDGNDYIDPNVQCAVKLKAPRVGRCGKPLACQYHSDAMKRAVPDRDHPFDELVLLDPVQLTGRQKGVSSVDPDKCCAVDDGKSGPCNRNLTCALHVLSQKEAVKGRSAPFKDLVKAFKLAAVKPSQSIDLDTCCAVNLGDGKRCNRNLICKIHKAPEKNKVKGRSAPFKELVRRYELSREKAKAARTKINLDLNCGVDIGDGAQCGRLLGCTLHELATKQKVQGRSAPLDELIHRHKLSNQKVTGQELNLDVNCGVIKEDGTPCTWGLTCRVHSDQDRSAVQGRSTTFEELVRRHELAVQRISTEQVDPDIHCAVGMDGGRRCNHSLRCDLHTLAEKQKVADRSLPVEDALAKQKALKNSPPKYGHFAATAGHKVFSIINLYRRSGVQTLDLDPEEAMECPTPGEIMISPMGPNLERVQQILNDAGTANFEQNILNILPKTNKRSVDGDRAKIVKNKDGYHFCFVSAEGKVRAKLATLQQNIAAGKTKDACIISAAQEFYKFTEDSAAAVMNQLQVYIARLPISLDQTTDSLKNILLHHAISAVNAAKVPYQIRKSTVDDRMCLVVHLQNFNHDLRTHETLVAIPLDSQPREGIEVPAREKFYAFQEEKWSGSLDSNATHRKLFDIASHVVSSLHLYRANPVQIRSTLCEISETFDVPLLFQFAEQAYDNALKLGAAFASYDEVKKVIRPSIEAKAVESSLPNIKVQDSRSAHLVLQCLNNRMSHTHDLWLAWSEAARAADEHNSHPEDPTVLACQCSEVKSGVELHRCFACRRMVVCKSLVKVDYEGFPTMFCQQCLPPNLSTDDELDDSWGTFQHDRHPEIHRVRRNILKAISPEFDIVFPDAKGFQSDARVKNRAAAYNALLPTFEEVDTPPGWQWTDAYFDTPVNQKGGPFGISVEAALPLILHEGLPRTHVGPNMRLVRLYGNVLCGTFPPTLLKAYHQLDASETQPEIDDGIARLDNLHLIRSQVPWSKTLRLERTYDPSFLVEFEQQCQTGLATLAGCETLKEQESNEDLSQLWRIRTVTVSKFEANLPELIDVQDFIESIEALFDFQFPRVNDVPYPFHGGPVPTEYSWCFLYAVIGVHFNTLRANCNSRWTTTFDLPRLICGIFFLLCWRHNPSPNPQQLFRVPCSIYTHHPTHLSAGKNDHSKEMSVGFADGVPISLDSFDLNNFNLCVEPWLANSAKGNRDDLTDEIRRDFRQNLKHDNPPLWPGTLPALDAEVTAQYIVNASGMVVLDEATAGDSRLSRSRIGDTPARPGADVSRAEATSAGRRGAASAVSQYRNMSNLGATCYLSNICQILCQNVDFRRLLNDDSKLLFKAETGSKDVLFIPAGQFIRDLDASQIAALRRLRVQNYQRLIQRLRSLFSALDAGGAKLSESVTQDILDRIHAINSRFVNVSDESAQAFSLILDSVSSAMDTSNPASRGVSESISKQQEEDNKAGRPPYPVELDAQTYWDAWSNEGNLSDMASMFYTQVVREIPCKTSTCPVTARGFEMTNMIYLDLPSSDDPSETGADPNRTFRLGELLDAWALEPVAGDGHRCEHDSSHEPCHTSYRCITRPAQYICFGIRRGGVYHHDFNIVEMPEVLDLVKYTSLRNLPSHQRVAGADDAESGPVTYDLAAVSNWVNGGHYKGYVAEQQSEQDRWVQFDDMKLFPRRKSPQQSWTEGELTHFGMYKRRSADVQMLDPPANRSSDETGTDLTIGGGEKPGMSSTRPAVAGPSTARVRSPPESMAQDRVTLRREQADWDVSIARTVAEFRAREEAVSRREREVELKEKAIAARQQEIDEAATIKARLATFCNERDEQLRAITAIEQRLAAVESRLEAEAHQIAGQRAPFAAQFETLDARSREIAEELAAERRLAQGQIQDCKERILALVSAR
ncbi:unnamed protein product [Zymoseptoria tritici ST99CH_3D1]|nr:unnamed protein product [Zymoseptoria tritici ST99CH_3D1]